MKELLQGLVMLCSLAAGVAAICAVGFWLVAFIEMSYRHAFPKPKKSRLYGHNETIHQTTHIDVEVCNGQVVALWFRCLALPFRVSQVDAARMMEVTRLYSASTDSISRLVAVEIEDAA